MDIERRAAPRHRTSVYFNKYIDGHPYVAEVIELSLTGMLLRKIHEPDAPRAAYAIELAAGEDERMWLCGTPVWTSGPFEALGFVGQSAADRERLLSLLAALPR